MSKIQVVIKRVVPEAARWAGASHRSRMEDVGIVYLPVKMC